MTRGLITAMPFALVALALATEGLRFHSQPDLRAYSNGLGRICFVLAILLLAGMARRVLRPTGEIMQAAYRRETQSWAGKMRFIWFPLVMVLLLAPALLASTGYYVTGFMLVYRSTGTLMLTVVVLLAAELLVRWRSVREPAAVGLSATESGTGSGGVEADTQVRRLARFSLGVVWVVGFLMIWSAVLPSLQVLERVEIWPQVRFIELASGVPGSEADAAAVDQEAPAASSAQEDQPSPGGVIPPTGLVPGGERAQPPEPDSSPGYLTLAGLLDAILVLVVTTIIAKNIPALLEFIVLKRTPLQPGVRMAVTTLFRYLIVIVGVSAAANVIGLGWQRVQWLAAALTFGLGFGLQEIFANFVSGLIILIDRPIRVGDVVTIGDIGGWVTRISIRATTITKWDRSELIVPNREFITGQLTNWTLSNSLTRVELKIGVEYGSDVEKVRRVLLEVANNHPAILKDPPAYVVLMEFGASSVDFELRVYLDYEYGRLTIRDELQRRVVTAFKENGIVIAFPQLDLHVKSGVDRALPPAEDAPPPPRATPRGLQDADE